MAFQHVSFSSLGQTQVEIPPLHHNRSFCGYGVVSYRVVFAILRRNAKVSDETLCCFSIYFHHTSLAAANWKKDRTFLTGGLVGSLAVRRRRDATLPKNKMRTKKKKKKKRWCSSECSGCFLTARWKTLLQRRIETEAPRSEGGADKWCLL